MNLEPMNLINKHLNKNNLHHAYLIEGMREEVVPEILKFVETLGVKTVGNPEFCHISTDSFRIEDARNLKSFGVERGFTHGKKIFLISANSFLLEAQNSLLKMFEEPIADTHFFVVVPDANALLKTLVSRFYVIRSENELKDELDGAEKFINMSLLNRIDFIKELLIEPEEETEIISLDSARSKALKFLNSLEILLHSRFIKNFSGLTLPGVPGGTYTVQNSLQTCLQHVFKVREFLRMPGSSTKTLMESIALVVPNF